MEIFRSVAELRRWSRHCRTGSTPGALKGHDFSRAVTGIGEGPASASEGISSIKPDGSNDVIGLYEKV